MTHTASVPEYQPKAFYSQLSSRHVLISTCLHLSNHVASCDIIKNSFTINGSSYMQTLSRGKKTMNVVIDFHPSAGRPHPIRICIQPAWVQDYVVFSWVVCWMGVHHHWLALHYCSHVGKVLHTYWVVKKNNGTWKLVSYGLETFMVWQLKARWEGQWHLKCGTVTHVCTVAG